MRNHLSFPTVFLFLLLSILPPTLSAQAFGGEVLVIDSLVVVGHGIPSPNACSASGICSRWNAHGVRAFALDGDQWSEVWSLRSIPGKSRLSLAHGVGMLMVGTPLELFFYDLDSLAHGDTRRSQWLRLRRVGQVVFDLSFEPTLNTLTASGTEVGVTAMRRNGDRVLSFLNLDKDGAGRKYPSWSLGQQILDLPPHAGGMDLAGDLLAVANPGERVVHVFERDGDGSWSPTTELVPPAAHEAMFGASVVVADGEVLVGQPGIEPSAQLVHRFAKVAGQWSQIGTITSSKEGDSSFGTSLAFNGTTLFVAGAAHLSSFVRQGGDWSLTGVFDVGLGRDGGARVGHRTLAASDNVVAFGDPGADFGRGAITVLVREGDSWSQSARLSVDADDFRRNRWPPQIHARSLVEQQMADGRIGWDVARPTSVYGDSVASSRALLFRDTIVIKNVSPGAFVTSWPRADAIWVDKGDLILTLNVDALELRKMQAELELARLVHPPVQVVTSSETFRQDGTSAGLSAGFGAGVEPAGNSGSGFLRFSASVSRTSGVRNAARITRVITHRSFEALMNRIVGHYISAMSVEVRAPASGYVYIYDHASNSPSLGAGVPLIKIEPANVVRGHMWFHLNQFLTFTKDDPVTVTLIDGSVHSGVVTEVGTDPCTFICQAYTYSAGDTMAQRKPPAIRTRVTIETVGSLAESLAGVAPFGTAISGEGRVFKNATGHVAIPVDAVTTRAGLPGVFVAHADYEVGRWRASFRPVHLSGRDPVPNIDDLVAVDSGLVAGAIVLTGNTDRLGDGATLGRLDVDLFTTHDCSTGCPTVVLNDPSELVLTSHLVTQGHWELCVKEDGCTLRTVPEAFQELLNDFEAPWDRWIMTHRAPCGPPCGMPWGVAALPFGTFFCTDQRVKNVWFRTKEAAKYYCDDVGLWQFHQFFDDRMGFLVEEERRDRKGVKQPFIYCAFVYCNWTAEPIPVSEADEELLSWMEAAILEGIDVGGVAAGAPDSPVRVFAREQMNQFAEWLSERAGHRYQWVTRRREGRGGSDDSLGRTTFSVRREIFPGLR